MPITRFKQSIEKNAGNINMKSSSNQLPPIEAAPQKENYPLSFQQESMWFLCQVQPQNPMMNLCYCSRWYGDLHVNALKKAVQHLINRHSALRTGFSDINGDTYQVISHSPQLELSFLHLAHLDESRGEQRARELSEEEARSPFDLYNDLPIRFKLIKLKDANYILIFNVHHITADGASIQVIREELTSLYNAYVKGKQPSLPAIRLQHHDFCLWQRKVVDHGYLVQQEDYWLKEFAGPLPVLRLAASYNQLPTPRFLGASVKKNLDKDLKQKLLIFSFRNMATLFLTLLSAFYVLLYKYSSQEDIIIKTAFAGRHRSLHLRHAIGFFVNLLAIRADLSGNPTFGSLLQQVKGKINSAHDYQDYPFHLLVEKINSEPDMNRLPLSQIAFNMQTAPSKELKWQGLIEKDWYKIDPMNVLFDITVDIIDSKGGLEIKFSYRTDLFLGSTVDNMVNHYIEILDHISSDKNVRLKHIDLSHGPLAISESNGSPDDDEEDFNF
ncbi:MAG: condensation domain-containing protein [Candidatus Aminicenantes bacterium]|jgi:hypothetical protein